jgi:hypothetical protein
MGKIGTDCNDTRIKYRLFKDQEATIHVQEGRNIEAKIKKGVRQGCNLSPELFTMYMEEAIKEIEEQGIKVNGE